MTLENIKLDVEYVRSQFPAFKDPLSKVWSFFENAGWRYVPINVINKLSSKYNLEIIDYTVAPVFMEKNKKGAHQWFIEFKNIPSEKINIAQIIDEELKLENSDYDAKRYNDFTLKKPEIIISKRGVFLKWLELNNKMGGQNKIPRLSNERKFIESLIELNN